MRALWGLPIALAAIITACGQAEHSQAPVARPVAASPLPASPPSGRAVSDSKAIVGEWRVAGVDGRAIDQPFAITASILPQEIHAVSQCVRWRWRADIRDGKAQLISIAPAEPPCARTRSGEETAFERAMSAARFAVRRGDGSLVFAGPAGEVTLFTQ